MFGDESIEHLIGNNESGEHSTTILKDDARLDHRINQGVFADAAAVVIFDDRVMVVLPSHANSIRIYDGRIYAAHAMFIRESISQLRDMRR